MSFFMKLISYYFIVIVSRMLLSYPLYFLSLKIFLVNGRTLLVRTADQLEKKAEPLFDSHKGTRTGYNFSGKNPNCQAQPKSQFHFPLSFATWIDRPRLNEVILILKHQARHLYGLRSQNFPVLAWHLFRFSPLNTHPPTYGPIVKSFYFNSTSKMNFNYIF